jgi:phage tail tape-measure protein
MATELLINIVSQATGKGFLESEKAVNKLEKKVKSLGKTLGISLAAGAALKFSKIYVKAFAEDEKATLQLTKAVDNLGLGFASPSINKYIENLEKTAAISRTELRPAFQDLLSTTGSLTTAQDLLNKSIIISRGSGIALSTVTEDLTKV